MANSATSAAGGRTQVQISGVDLFCGVGGLTYGLRKAGITVRAGFDIDEECRYPYEANNPGTRFLSEDVAVLSGDAVADNFDSTGYRLLAGCAPCQPFSLYTQGKNAAADPKWPLLAHFGRLVKEVEPDFVTMENVPSVTKHTIFKSFMSSLNACGYQVNYKVVNCSEIGLPQIRQRLVLVASRLGPIEIKLPTAPERDVRWAIGGLRPVAAGGQDDRDPIHVAAGVSDLNLRRLRASRPGGSWKDWPEELRAKCHRKESGKGYSAVYGRMRWDTAAPTITTLCHGFGNGRFGHPQQDRAITLREAALLQSFPTGYEFVPKGQQVRIATVGRLIGNAVPPLLGTIIGKSIMAAATRQHESCQQLSSSRRTRNPR